MPYLHCLSFRKSLYVNERGRLRKSLLKLADQFEYVRLWWVRLLVCKLTGFLVEYMGNRHTMIIALKLADRLYLYLGFC